MPLPFSAHMCLSTQISSSTLPAKMTFHFKWLFSAFTTLQCYSEGLIKLPLYVPCPELCRGWCGMSLRIWVLMTVSVVWWCRSWLHTLFTGESEQQKAFGCVRLQVLGSECAAFSRERGWKRLNNFRHLIQCPGFVCLRDVTIRITNLSIHNYFPY